MLGFFLLAIKAKINFNLAGSGLFVNAYQLKSKIVLSIVTRRRFDKLHL
jgi:hypothetical protein